MTVRDIRAKMDNENSLSLPDYDELILQITEQIKSLEAMPESEIKTKFFDLLQSLDLLHREGLRRIIHILENEAEPVLRSLENDAIVATLLLLYDFITQPPSANNSPQNSPPAAMNGGFVPLTQVKLNPSLKQPIWIPAGKRSDFPEGRPIAKILDDEPILFCNVENQIYAVRNACLDSILPLEMGTLEGFFMTCSWHGCKYDLRTGEIQNGSGEKIETFPVQVDGKGVVRVGFNVPDWQR